MRAPRIASVSVIATCLLGSAVLVVAAQDGISTGSDASPEPSAAPTESIGPEPTQESRVIELTVDDFVSIRDPETGAKVSDIPLTPGETVVFRVDNVGSISHNFYVGTDEELALQFAATDVGIADWSEGVRELTWMVPEDIADLKFGCTVWDHYFLMQGTFSISP